MILKHRLIHIYFYTLAILVFFIIGTNNSAWSQYPSVTLNDLKLTKKARKLNHLELATVSPAKEGFIWNQEDNTTPNYRPQGVTTIHKKNRKFIAVSWYGRKQENHENRGARISFVDITNMDSISYCHVLLVDENNKTFSGIHAGGLLFKDDTLYIPDTRKEGENKIYGFALNDIQEVPSNNRNHFYDYQYILKRTSSYQVPIRPDCISYDWDSEEFLIASFRKRCIFKFTFNPHTTFSWFKSNQVSKLSSYHKGFFDEIQGIASMNHPVHSQKKVIWASTSYGRNNKSILYVTSYNRNPNFAQGQNIAYSDLNYNSYLLPAGTEDLHLENNNKTLWTLTEFTPNEGDTNNRFVFAFEVPRMLPE